MTALALCLALAVTDGDSIKCAGERVRIFGLDCAEMDTAAGRAAKARLAEFLAGREVRLERRGMDRYGRTVARVEAGGQDVACWMIRQGYCVEYRRYSRGAYRACAAP